MRESASFFNADKYYRCYNKKDWWIKYVDYTIGKDRNIHEVHILWETNQVNGLCMA